MLCCVISMIARTSQARAMHESTQIVRVRVLFTPSGAGVQEVGLSGMWLAASLLVHLTEGFINL
jgi:hypothetical protein